MQPCSQAGGLASGWLTQFIEDGLIVKVIEKIRSIASFPKWILFIGIVGSTWLLGQEVWFRKVVAKGREFKPENLNPLYQGEIGWTADWEWVFLSSIILALLSYSILFGLKKKD